MEQLDKKFPKGALSFYIKLYCKRKGETKAKGNAVREAMKSWISISKLEKQFFINKYNEYRTNLKKKYALYLKNAEPYLKTKGKNLNPSKERSPNINDQEKDIDMCQDNVGTSKLELENDTECSIHDLIPDAGTMNKDEIVNDNNCSGTNSSITYLLSQDEIISTEEPTPLNAMSQHEVVSIAEPIPPKVITARDLFQKIKEKDPSNFEWEKLTKAQKSRYQVAVRDIKKKYLKEYTQYLEHLPAEILLSHYRSVVNSA